MTPKLFSELGLSAEVQKAVDKMGFEKASPIQAEAIPVLLTGKDIVGQSQTGSGKTAAFGIPAVEKVDPTKREVQVLILCPTRELAVQVSEEIHKLSFFKRGINALPIYGGQSYERQYDGLRRGAQIVIGTPGRVMDHMRRGTLRLDKIKMVILDEADVMLNMGFREDIETILKDAPVERQTVFFSATMPRPIRDLIEKYSREPQNVKIEQKAMTVPTVEQVYFEVDRRYKMELLTRLIDLHDIKLGIVFCNTKRMVDDLVDHLEAAGYQADRLHGDMTQAMRDRVMNKFRKSGLEFLVATDVAARGIDVDDVEVVFNYDLPYDPEDYVHRIGRTGRAGRSGRAISLVPYRELFQIRNIERFTNVRIQRGKIPTVDEVTEARENVFLEKIRAVIAAGDFKKQEHIVERLLEDGTTSSTDVASALIHLLQSGEQAKPAPKTENYDRPQREERPPQRFDDRPQRPPFREERGGYGASRPGRFDDRGERGGYRDDRRPAYGSQREERGPRQFDDRAPRFEKRPYPAAKAPFTKAPFAKPAFEKGGYTKPTTKAAAKTIASAPAPVATSEPAPAETKTYSDAEILASLATSENETHGNAESKPKSGAKSKTRGIPGEYTRIWMSVGETQGIAPIDVVNAVSGETGLPGKTVGTVDVREKHLFADVAAEHANAIISKLNRSTIKGHKIKVKLA